MKDWISTLRPEDIGFIVVCLPLILIGLWEIAFIVYCYASAIRLGLSRLFSYWKNHRKKLLPLATKENIKPQPKEISKQIPEKISEEISPKLTNPISNNQTLIKSTIDSCLTEVTIE